MITGMNAAALSRPSTGGAPADLARRLVLNLLVASALLAGFAPGAPARDARCGAFEQGGSLRYEVSRSGAETCGHAMRIVKSFIRDYDTWKQHGDGVLYRTYWTNKKFPKWRCAQGSGGGSCRRGKKVALYSSTYIGD